MARALVKRSGVYYVRIRRGGWETYVSTGNSRQPDARRAAERIVAEFDREKAARHISGLVCRYAMELARREATLSDVAGPLAHLEREEFARCLDMIAEIFPAHTTTARDVFAAYRDSGRKEEAKDKTIRAREAHFAAFARWAGDRDMSRLDTAMCRAALDALGVSGQTRNNYISDLSVIFSRAGIPAPWKELREKAEHAEREVLDISAAKAFLEWCAENPEEKSRGISASRWAVFIRCLYYTGLRPSDVCHLRRSEIRGGLVELSPEKTSRTRKKVSFVADTRLLDILSALPDDGSGYYLPDFHALYEKDSAHIATGLQLLFQKAGMPKDAFLPYSFRHNFVTAQIDSGAKLEDIAAAVGHVSTDTTSEYYYHGRRAVELNSLPEI